PRWVDTAVLPPAFGHQLGLACEVLGRDVLRGQVVAVERRSLLRGGRAAHTVSLLCDDSIVSAYSRVAIAFQDFAHQARTDYIVLREVADVDAGAAFQALDRVLQAGPAPDILLIHVTVHDDAAVLAQAGQEQLHLRRG